MRRLAPALRFAIFLACCGVVALLALELRERHQADAWPFEASLYVPPYLSARDAPLRWRYSAGNGRNSLGLRNRELQPKPSGTRRILFLGDSLIWSATTSSGELYTAMLERRLNARTGATPVEVINAGVPGYTTYQELEFLRIYGLEMQPDRVILGFVLNDLYDPYLHKPTAANSLLATDPSAFLHRFDPRGFPGALVGWSYLAHHVAFTGPRLWKSWTGRPQFLFDERLDLYLAWKSHAWEQARSRIGEMRRLLAERGIALDLLVFPISDQMDQAYRAQDEAYVLYPQRRIREICHELAIPMLDLTEALYQHGGVSLFRDYLHLGPGGNDIVMDEIQARLLAREP